MPDWPEILTRDGPTAWRAAYRVLGNRADADECFQEACLAALEISRREVVRQWPALLGRLAVARAVDRLRKRGRRRLREQVTDLGSLEGGAPRPSQRIEDQELAEQLRAALARIPAKQSELFCLHCLEHWSYQEIAVELGISTGRVGVLLYRARAKLARLLAASAGAEANRRASGIGTKSKQEEPT